MAIENILMRKVAREIQEWIYLGIEDGMYRSAQDYIQLTAQGRTAEASDNNYYTSELVGTYNTTTGLLYFDVIQGASVTLEIPILNVKKSFVVPAETLYKISDIG